MKYNQVFEISRLKQGINERKAMTIKSPIKPKFIMIFFVHTQQIINEFENKLTHLRNWICKVMKTNHHKLYAQIVKR